MLTVLVKLRHSLVWRSIRQHIPKDVDSHKVGIRIPKLQLMIMLDLLYDRNI